MNIKTLKIIGIIVACIVPFPLHYLYDTFPNFFTTIFSPVNESIWEHMKLLFGSIMFSSLIEKIILLIKNENVNNLCYSNFIGALLSIPIFLFIFLPIYYLFGENLIITLIIMFIAIIISKVISYKLINKYNYNLDNKVIFFVIIVYIIFTLFTYFPLKNNLFVDPITNKCGINKE